MSERRWRRIAPLAIVATALAVRGPLAAGQDAEAPAEDPAHDELRKLRDEAVDAFKVRDIERLVACLHPDVVVIPQNAEIFRGHAGVREFHKRMSEGDDRTVVSQETEFEVDELSILYGDDTAIAFGGIHDHFTLSNGMEFDLTSKWTATMVKTDGKWLVASFQATANMFDNGVSQLMLKWNSAKFGGGGLLIGALVAGGAVVLVRRRRA
ncbi:MAG: polyketide cyclase [Planctomycetaceae bacterium]|nr:polyketide cyclase [Planctomycetaceae bacterium]